MSGDASTLDGLLLRWRDLPQGDRRAIMGHLPPERQAVLTRALHRMRAEDRPSQGRYAGYSRWLADLLAICATETPLAPTSPIKPLVRQALAEGHAQATETLATGKPFSLLDLIRTALSERGFLR